MDKGQFAMEFIMMMAFAIVVSMLFLSASGGLLAERSEDWRTRELNEIGYLIQDELILAAQVTDGYTREFFLPEKAGRFPYALTSGTSTVTLTSGQTILTFDIPAILGTVHKGTVTISKQGNITVT